MEFVRTIIRSEELTGIIDIPESLKSRLVEILILPCDEKIVPYYKRRWFCEKQNDYQLF